MLIPTAFLLILCSLSKIHPLLPLAYFSSTQSLYNTASVHYRPLGIGDTLANCHVHKHRLIHEGWSTSFSRGTTPPQRLRCYKGRRYFSISKAYSYAYCCCFLIIVLTQILPLPPKKQLQQSSTDNFRKSALNPHSNYEIERWYLAQTKSKMNLSVSQSGLHKNRCCYHPNVTEETEAHRG